jgi:hypothetical protein
MLELQLSASESRVAVATARGQLGQPGETLVRAVVKRYQYNPPLPTIMKVTLPLDRDNIIQWGNGNETILVTPCIEPGNCPIRGTSDGEVFRIYEARMNTQGRQVPCAVHTDTTHFTCRDKFDSKWKSRGTSHPYRWALYWPSGKPTWRRSVASAYRRLLRSHPEHRTN